VCSSDLLAPTPAPDRKPTDHVDCESRGQSSHTAGVPAWRQPLHHFRFSASTEGCSFPWHPDASAHSLLHELHQLVGTVVSSFAVREKVDQLFDDCGITVYQRCVNLRGRMFAQKPLRALLKQLDDALTVNDLPRLFERGPPKRSLLD